MGREDHVLEVDVGGVFGRLFGKDVERGTGHVAGLESFDERGIFHQFAARAVNDAHALLHGGEVFRIDEAGGLRGEADVEGEIV